MKGSITAKFIGCSPNPAVLRRSPLPEVLFLGRSNVGKSSLINRLVGQKGLAHTSSTPGKTKLFYFYEIGSRCLFVDPPGYGYAKVAEDVRTRWMIELEKYVRKAERLLGVILIMDIRHAPLTIDIEMAKWLEESQLNFTVVLNKSDKLGRHQQAEALRKVSAQIDFPEKRPMLLFSTQTGEGREELWKVLNEWIEKEKFS